MKTPSPQEAAKWAREKARSTWIRVASGFWIPDEKVVAAFEEDLLETDKNAYERGRKDMADAIKTIDDRPLTDKEIAHGLKIQIERDEALLRECYLAVNGVRFPELFEKLKARLAPSVGLTDAKEPK